MPVLTARQVRRALPALAAAAAAVAVLAGASPACGPGRLSAGSPGGARAVFGGTWGSAEEVPGTAALNEGFGFAQTGSVSCASPGNCSAGGFYSFTYTTQPNAKAFVVSEVNGTWGTAEEVPGTAQGGFAWTNSVSCASAGNCAAGGWYRDSSGTLQAFVVSESNGTWGTAINVPGTAGGGAVWSVSCARAGNCRAGGWYTNSSGNAQAFVVTQTDGAWGTAEEVPGTAALNQGGYAQINSVSRAPAGTCAAGGLYTDSSGNQQAFVVNKPSSQQPGPRQAAASPRHAPARPWHWRAPATCHPAIAGSPARGPLMPLGPATTSHCLMAQGGRWPLPGYPGLPR